jgi:hypothetical protein
VIAPLPDTALVREARALVTAALDEGVLHHSLRAFHLGKVYAERRAIRFDEEELCLAALFHDLGLAPGRRPPKVAFTLAGSLALARFLDERGASRDRVARVTDAVDFHMQLLPRWSKGPAAGLLQIGAWMDVTGLRRGAIASEARAIEEALPAGDFRGDFNRRLLRTLDSTAACLGLLLPTTVRAHARRTIAAHAASKKFVSEWPK